MANRSKISSGHALWVFLLGVWALSFIYRDSPLVDFTFCIWKNLTDLNCAGCGLTRSFCTMSEMNLKGAFDAHPVGPLLYLAMMWHLFAFAMQQITAKSESFKLPAQVRNGYWVITLIVFVVHLSRTVLSWN